MFSPEAHETLRDYGRGCHVYAEGVMVQGKQGLLFRAAAVHAAQRASPLERFRTRLRLALLEKFRGPVWGGLGQALLLGARDDLDAGLSAAFRDAGCSHILALSGMHLALLSGLLAFLLKRPLGLKGAALAGGIFVIFYVFLAGAQASLVRSALMYMVGALSLWACLKVNVKLSLALSFLAQITIWSGEGLSLSFILSYLALAGILWIGGLAAPLLRGKLPPFLASGAAASVGAFLASAAVTAFCFGALRPIGLAAGLVLAPLAELFMVLALAALALSFSLPALLYPLDKALSLLYRLLEYLTRAAARAPGLVTGSAWPVLAASIAACLALWLLCRRKEAQLQRMGPFG
jgi:competence protein ComEC